MVVDLHMVTEGACLREVDIRAVLVVFVQSMRIALNKPYGLFSQFTHESGLSWGTLGELHLPKGVSRVSTPPPAPASMTLQSRKGRVKNDAIKSAKGMGVKNCPSCRFSASSFIGAIAAGALTVASGSTVGFPTLLHVCSKL